MYRDSEIFTLFKSISNEGYISWIGLSLSQSLCELIVGIDWLLLQLITDLEQLANILTATAISRLNSSSYGRKPKE